MKSMTSENNTVHNFLPALAREGSDDDSHEDAEEEWLSEETELLLHSL